MDNFLAQSQTQVMTYFECEKLIENIHLVKLEDFGSQEWLNQNQLWSKLNLQAHLNASQQGEEFVMELLSTFDKTKILVTELIQNEIWKYKVLPQIKDQVLTSGIRSYLSIFHEEIITYHQTAWDSLDNYCIDLIEYVYTKLSQLIEKQDQQRQSQQIKSESQNEEFNKNLKKINFEIQMSCFSILRYSTDHLKKLNISISSYLMKEKDVLLLLIQLLEVSPWKYKENGKLFYWQDKKFIEQNDEFFLCKEEAQIWLTIYNLLYTEQTAQIYEINDYRKNNLLRLKKFLNDVRIDQIPVLTSLKKTLEELSIMNVSQNFKSNPFIIQSLPEIKNSIMNAINMKQIISKQKNIFSKNFDQSEMQILDSLTDVFTGFTDVKQNEDKNFCAFCSKLAEKRCSRCKKVYYCSKECQVSHYKTIHKKVCQKNQEENSSQIRNVSTKKINLNQVNKQHKEKILENNKNISTQQVTNFEELDQLNFQKNLYCNNFSQC